MAEYHLFWRGPFSQWHTSPFKLNDISFSCAEQYMMYQKAMLFGDNDTAEAIIQTSNPKTHKSLGRKVKGFGDKLWEMHRERIVYEGNFAKFTQNPELFNILMSTGEKILVEANPVDTIWGIGLSEDNPDALIPAKWKGQNLLGKVLTQVRDDLKNIIVKRELTPE